MVPCPQIGKIILGRYQVLDLLDIGGQASVALAVCVDTGEKVAVRMFGADATQENYAEELARFKRAGELSIVDPAVNDPIDYGEEDGHYYTISPFVDGADLHTLVQQQGGRLSLARSLEIIGGVADGLTAIHEQGIVHRDIKPANIMIARDGRPSIIDFGICRKIHDVTLTRQPGLLGTPEWMAPEQVASPQTVDRRADLYALGAVLYFVLTGRPPIQGEDLSIVAMRVCQYIPPKPSDFEPSIPGNIDQICMRLLEKEPAARFQTAREVSDAISAPGRASPSTRFCPSCGAALPAGGRFCHSCGLKTTADPSGALLCLACGGKAGCGPSCNACGRSFSEVEHRLRFSTGSPGGREFRIPVGEYEVGRQQLSTRDHHISRRHFRVECLNGTVRVQDVGSANRTRVGGRSADSLVLLSIEAELCVAGCTAAYTRFS